MHCLTRKAALALVAVVAIAGCAGEDGKDGTNGTNGTNGVSCTSVDNGDGSATITCPNSTPFTVSDGAAGAPGASCSAVDNKNGSMTVTCTTGGAFTVPTGPAANESCAVCHAPTRLWPAYPFHDILPFASGTQDDVVISAVTVADNGGKFQINYHLANSAGPITNSVAGDLRVYFAEITSGGVSNYLDRWTEGYERSGTFDWNADSTITDTRNYPWGTWTNLGGGNYSYVSAADIADAPSAAAQRIFFRVGRTGMNTGNFTYDFLPADVTTSIANARDIVPTATCNRCHEARIADHGHGGGYNKTEACDVCHSPLLDESFYTSAPHDMAALGFDLTAMAHQIHGAINHLGLTGVGMDWSAVTYPATLNDCTVCHTGGAQSDNFKTNPNAGACTSCHTFVRFEDQANYNPADLICGDPAWTYPNPCTHEQNIVTTDACNGCHTANKIVGYHDPSINSSHVPTAINVPEFKVNMVVSGSSGAGFFVPGTDTLTIDVTLTNPDDSAVPSTFYTAAKHTAGTTSATALSNARLYVYGPRTAPKPVLTAASKVTPIPTQSTQLMLAGATDPGVVSTASGFKYQVAIPAGFPAGTYFVRFYATNYGYVSDTNYVTDSNAFQVIQIGTATADEKISGDCTRCHGDHLAPFHDSRHGVKFDTDECISCHDLSENHAAPLANRVHAVHSASTAGDVLVIDWAEVEYPVGTRNGGVLKCSVCHSSANVQYQSTVSQAPCQGCHGDNPGAIDHMRQNGGGF